jgi:amino acid adenylation domain-containing protein
MFSRPVSPTEWFYLAAARSTPPLAIQLFVEGDGHVDRDDLVRAVAVASEACPGARLVRRGRTWVDSGQPPPVRTVDNAPDNAAAMIGTTSGKLWPRAGSETTTSGKLCGSTELWRPLDSENGPTCEVLIAEGTLVFRAFHGVMDGRGVLAWAADVFRALRGEPPLDGQPPVGGPSRVTDYSLLNELGAPGRRPALTANWRSPPSQAGQPGWARRTVDGNHPGLVAKVAAAIAAYHGKHHGDWRYRFMVPVDLRRHDPALVSTANLSLPIFVDAVAGDGWEQLHERVLRALAERRELAGGTAERWAYRLPLSVLAAALRPVGRRNLCSAIVSHLGRVDPAEFSTGEFTAYTVYSLPVHAPFAPLSVVATEPPGRTELTVAHQGADREAEALLDAIERALSPDELRDWAGNRTRREARTNVSAEETADVTADMTVTDLFRRQVEATPDAVALTGPQQAGPQGTVTYAELDRRADVVAHELSRRGIGPGDVVGLLSDRTVEAIAGLWGVLKAGAAYLPLDPQYPDGRITYILDDAQAKVCLVTRNHAGRLASHETAGPETASRDTVILDDLPAAGAPKASTETKPGDLVYVIYTSGSTGRPKGVQIEHRNLVNYVSWATELYRVDRSTRFALFTSLAFDLSGSSIFLPLLAGGSIALVPEDVSHRSLRTMLEDSGADALKLTPAHLDLIGRLGLTPQGFRVLIVGGEQLRGAVAARAQRAFGPDCRIVNEYGPTEATIGCVVHVFDAERDALAPRVPIGVPVADTTVYLLDAHRRHVGRGGIGELYLAGAQLARGYLGRPDLDRERFVRLADGTRAYRTGDLARLTADVDTADGVLEYLGRTDDQIKIRGHRVEPGEIEAALEEHPQVARAVVVARDQTLCGYVITRDAEPPSSDALRRHLAERLPHYMVPGAIVAVAELPHTTNGKIDVRALPDPFAPSHMPAAKTAVESAVRDDVEQAVAKIWASILEVDVDRIGPDTDFHSLGGDSLSLIEMFAAVTADVAGRDREEAFMTDLRDVIRNPTLAAVCAAARRAVA